MEEMMDRQGQGQSRGSKELEVSLEQQEGSSAQDSNQRCALQAKTLPACSPMRPPPWASVCICAYL